MNTKLIFIFLFLFSVFLGNTQKLYAQKNTLQSVEYGPQPDFSSKNSLLIEDEITKKIKELDIEILTKYFLGKPAGTVATINGVPITLSEIENIADMQSSMGNENDLSLEGVLDEYSIYLFELIKQKLIKQELEARNISIDFSQVSSIEDIIRASYGEENFDKELLNDGININFWREQLIARIEYESFQKHLEEKLDISQDEIKNFFLSNKQNYVKPERYRLFLYSSENKEDIEKAHQNKMNAEDAKALNITVQEGSFNISSLPVEWKEEVLVLDISEQTAIKEIDSTFNYIVLQNKITANQEAIFLEIEQALLNQKLEKSYSEWIIAALNSSEIFIVPEFLTIIENKQK